MSQHFSRSWQPGRVVDRVDRALDRRRGAAKVMQRQDLDRRDVARCRSCGAEIVWAVTKGGKRVPIDFEQCDGGNVLLLPDGSCRVLRAGDSAELLASGTRHKSHFATCPQGRR